MIKKICLTVVFIFIFTSEAFADEIFYFEMANGEEITVVVDTNGSSDFLMTFLSPDNEDPVNVFRRYISEGLAGNLYFYDYVTCPTGSCHVGYFKTKKNLSPNNIARKAVEAGATQAGVRTVDAVFDMLTENTTAQTSKFQFVVVNGQNGKPVALCAITANGGCDPADNVTISGFDDGSIGISYPLPTPGSADYGYNSNIANAINHYIVENQRMTLTCTSSVALVNGIEVITLRCFVSY